MLGNNRIVAFVGVRDPARAKAFYRDTLGLRLASEDSFALVFDAQGVMLRVTIVPEVTPAKYTVLGWRVPDIVATAGALVSAGVTLERFEALAQDSLGIWTAPSGARIAWFRDPDGNVLSITQF
ncbi:MAG: VOC family protein [Bryobacteraceae bacterium]